MDHLQLYLAKIKVADQIASAHSKQLTIASHHCHERQVDVALEKRSLR